MACDTPVVATEIAGGITRYILAGGDCGVLVPIGDTEALTAAVRSLLDDPELRTRIAQNALRRVADFDIHTAMCEHETLLEDLGTERTLCGRRRCRPWPPCRRAVLGAQTRGAS